MQELKCPHCGHLNPDIRELGYKLPATCGRCPYMWRPQDVMPADVAKIVSDNPQALYVTDEDSSTAWLCHGD